VADPALRSGIGVPTHIKAYQERDGGSD
jgi:hypothetical protein